VDLRRRHSEESGDEDECDTGLKEGIRAQSGHD
jgi:hypothetical protein